MISFTCVVFTIETSQQTPLAQLITSQHMPHVLTAYKARLVAPLEIIWGDWVPSNALYFNSCRLSRFGCSFLTYRRSQDFRGCFLDSRDVDIDIVEE
jgi:hypothetical protein